jgi:signal transduction histidine kinase
MVAGLTMRSNSSAVRNLRISIGPDSLRVWPVAGRVDASLQSTIALFADLTVRLHISLDDNELLVRFIGAPDEGRGPIARAVVSALTPEASSLGASIANTLHDMKNQIAAARQASAGTATLTRTQRLGREFTASRHVDHAKALARQLQAAGSLQTSSEGVTELSAYLRSYGALLLERLPREFHVITRPPRTAVAVPVDEATLSAILDNLAKNTQEALPDGGTIELTAACEDAVVHIEFFDDGPGVPDAVVDALQSGRTVQSTKTAGNGLGLVGVRNLVHRVGGTLAYVADRGGACWRLSLPVAESTAAGGTES